jgi:hypothetical protein
LIRMERTTAYSRRPDGRRYKSPGTKSPRTAYRKRGEMSMASRQLVLIHTGVEEA